MVGVQSFIFLLAPSGALLPGCESVSPAGIRVVRLPEFQPDGGAGQLQHPAEIIFQISLIGTRDPANLVAVQDKRRRACSRLRCIL